jgi:DNA polymerase-3 subunit alpha
VFWHGHVHSEFSALDGMGSVKALVDKAASLGQPAISLTDHGNMSGAFSLYTAARRAGIVPFIGLEPYVVADVADKDAQRHHMTLLAYTTEGYQNLARLSTLTHQPDHYHAKPRFDLGDLASIAADGKLKGIACLTGCYFGLVCQAIVTAKDEDAGMASAAGIVGTLQLMFDKVYVEVQHHHTAHEAWDDDRLVGALYKLSLRTGAPPFVTNDCHYCDKADKPLHDMMKSIAYRSDASEVAFPGDSYHLASELWVKGHYRNHPAVWEASQAAQAELLSLNTLSIPHLETYKYHVPSIAKDADATLRELCQQSHERLGHLGSPAYDERLGYELSVIAGLGFADYFLLVHDYVEWAIERNIFVMARGSAAGSLVCWLLGFTQVDPLFWGLSFDRFLTPDRIRPPDIDLDIEDKRRHEIVDYLVQKHQIGQIGTYNRLAFDDETGKGSLFVQFAATQRKLLGDDLFAERYGSIRSLHALGEVEPDVAKKIMDLSDIPLRRSPGAHAAGFVVGASDHRIDDWLPLMYIPSSKTTVTQMMMDDIEDAGFIKIDLLGLRSLSTASRCLELLGKSGLGWIPLDDPATMAFLRQGKPGTGVFQLEGWAASRGCRQVKVKTVKDIILVNALYRPATRDSGYVETFLANRKQPKKVTYPHPIFRRHLEETYGVPAFQEQVLGVLRDLGMPVEELNDFLKAVKAKHAKAGYSDASAAIFAEHEAKFLALCEEVGMDKAAQDYAWTLVEGFVAYGFNKAHATAYGLFGYQLAYLKVHHPLEFHTALLETSVGTPKEDDYVKEVRRVGIPILPACINRSRAVWTIDPAAGAIRRGLNSLHGVGTKAAEEIAAGAPYSSVDDLASRTNPRLVTGLRQWAKKGTLSGVAERLRAAGALRSIGL